jgi:ABC-type phosphate/phosphonate transport system ATPase subunit
LGQLITEASAGGATVVVASHEANLVEPLAHRAVTITGGRVTSERIIRAVGEPAGEPVCDRAEPTPAPEAESVIHVA